MTRPPLRPYEVRRWRRNALGYRDHTRWRALKRIIQCWRDGDVEHDHGPGRKVRAVHFLKALR